MAVALPPLCAFCTHRNTQGKASLKGITCAAYPEGIPQRILDNDVDHREAYRGDHGIQFEPVDKAAEKFARKIMAVTVEG